MRADPPPYLHDAYPLIFTLLAVAAEAELRKHHPDHAQSMAFDIAEGVRTNIGGNFYRLPVFKHTDPTGDLFGDSLAYPRPEGPPQITLNASESSVDLLAYAHGWAAWIVARHDKTTDGATIDDIAQRITARFHRDIDGRDQTYIPRGARFDELKRYRKIYADFNGHNYVVLAIRHRLTENRIRQIVHECREADVAARQSRLDFNPVPPKKKAG